MPPKTDEDVEERKLLGKALSLLRERAELTQEGAAEAFAAIARPKGREEFSPQAWSAYETGVRAGIHSPLTQSRLAAAVGASREDLQLEVERLRGRDPSSHGRPHPAPRLTLSLEGLPENLGHRLRMPDDSLRPWANSHTLIVYDVDQWPRPD